MSFVYSVYVITKGKERDYKARESGVYEEEGRKEGGESYRQIVTTRHASRTQPVRCKLETESTCRWKKEEKNMYRSLSLSFVQPPSAIHDVVTARWTNNLLRRYDAAFRLVLSRDRWEKEKSDNHRTTTCRRAETARFPSDSPSLPCRSSWLAHFVPLFFFISSRRSPSREAKLLIYILLRSKKIINLIKTGINKSIRLDSCVYLYTSSLNSDDSPWNVY